jgi:hypothetical protein
VACPLSAQVWSELPAYPQVRIPSVLYLKFPCDGYLNISTQRVLWIRVGFNANPDPAFFLNADPDPESQTKPIRILILARLCRLKKLYFTSKYILL